MSSAMKFWIWASFFFFLLKDIFMKDLPVTHSIFTTIWYQISHDLTLYLESLHELDFRSSDSDSVPPKNKRLILRLMPAELQ